MPIQNGSPTRTIDRDVLSQDNAAAYWESDERFDIPFVPNGVRSIWHGDES